MLNLVLIISSGTPLQKIEIYFSPRGGCTDAIINIINNAKKSILVQAYAFTSMPIANALTNARNKGIIVKVLLDKSQSKGKGCVLKKLVEEGVWITIDKHKGGIAHNKVMIIDDEKVITGSFNFTSAAEDKNLENLVIITDTQVSKQYSQQWEKRNISNTYAQSGK